MLQKTHLQKKILEGNSSDPVNISSTEGNEKATKDIHKCSKAIPKNISEISKSRAHRSQRSHSPLRCYYCEKAGVQFETCDVKEYENHMATKHFRKPAYPTQSDMKRYGLTPQGKSWEV